MNPEYVKRILALAVGSASGILVRRASVLVASRAGVQTNHCSRVDRILGRALLLWIVTTLGTCNLAWPQTSGTQSAIWFDSQIIGLRFDS